MAEKATSGSLVRVTPIEGDTSVMEDEFYGSPDPSSSSGGDGRLVSSGDDISQGEDESTYDSGESDEKSTTVTKSNEDKVCCYSDYVVSIELFSNYRQASKHSTHLGTEQHHLMRS